MKYFDRFDRITEAFSLDVLRYSSSLPRLSLAVLILLLLGACASPITAKVTSFNQWPVDAVGTTFSFVRPAEKSNSLEQQAYEKLVWVELEKLGLKPATTGQAGRIQVDLMSIKTTRNNYYREAIYQNDYVFLSPVSDAAGNVFPGYWTRDPFGPRYMGERVVTRLVQVSNLKLRLLDAQGNSALGKPRTVFESTAAYEGDNENLADLMPYLVRAVFEGFPGENGRLRMVKFDPKTGEIVNKIADLAQ